MHQCQFDEVITIAFAEDHRIWHRLIRKTLDQNSDFDILAGVFDGQSLLNTIEETTAKPDVVIMGIRMPMKDGIATIEEIKRRWPQIKTIILSVNNFECVIEQMRGLGVNAYLDKGYDLNMLSGAIRNVHRLGFTNVGYIVSEAD